MTLLKDRFVATGGQALRRVTGTVLAPYQAAVLRIGVAGCVALYLLDEWPHRETLYGPGSPFGLDLARRLVELKGSLTVLPWSGSALWFELLYHAAIVVSVLLLLGWRTRGTSVLFMVLVLSLQNRSVYMGDGGDNVLHLMAIYLVFTRCGTVWSLDARRATRAAARTGQRAVQGPDGTGLVGWLALGAALALAQVTGFGALSLPWNLVFWTLWLLWAVWWGTARLARRGVEEPHALCDALTSMVHNCAMLVIAVEVCLIYATAGWYKIQGDKWQHGTALHYPLQLDFFRPWPALSDLLGSSALVVLLITYGTVMVQVAFPFTVFHRRIKNALLLLMFAEHLGIAVVMGLPFFSAAMLAADAVFLPTSWLRWMEARARGAALRLRRRAGHNRRQDEPEPLVTLEE